MSYSDTDRRKVCQSLHAHTHTCNYDHDGAVARLSFVDYACPALFGERCSRWGACLLCVVFSVPVHRVVDQLRFHRIKNKLMLKLMFSLY